MLLTAYNLPGYLLQKNCYSGFSALSNIISGNGEFLIEQLDTNNPRNTLLKCTLDEHSFVFKQPKFVTSGGILPILNEYLFYNSFPGLVVKTSQFSFDAQYHILLLPYLQSLPELTEVISCSSNLEIYASKAAHSLALFHQYLKTDNNPAVKVFVQNNCFNSISYYQSFINLLLRGAKHPLFLDEMVFHAFAYIAPSRAILHSFLHKKSFIESLEDLSTHFNEDYLVHGDLKIENLLQAKGENTLKFIDFENVSKGDHAWDLACFLESVLYQPAFRRNASAEKRNETLSKRYFFFAEYLNCYCQTFDFNDIEHYRFISKVLKCWALRKLEKLRIYDGNFNYFLTSMEVIKKLMLDTDKYIEQIYESGNRRFDVFDF